LVSSGLFILKYLLSLILKTPSLVKQSYLSSGRKRLSFDSHDFNHILTKIIQINSLAIQLRAGGIRNTLDPIGLTAF